MHISPISNEDIEFVRALQPPDWSDIIPYIQYYIQSPFCYPLKLSDDETIAGIGSLILHDHTAWLAHIIVHPDFRNRGLGREIVNALVQHPEARNIASKLLVATKLGEPVYTKAGFRVVTTYLFFKREEPAYIYTPAPEISDLKHEHISQLLEMDIRVSGENRSKVLESHLTDARVYLESNQLSGFYLPHLGEGLIIADTPTAGLELMKLKYASTEKAVLPEENLAGIHFLKENGFNQTSEGKRMILGEDIPWQPQKLYSRIGGNLG